MTKTVAIIGGGIIGYAVAWEICHSFPEHEVILLDQDIPGAGASARSAGLHFPVGRNPKVREMSRYSETFYKDLKETYSEVPIKPLALRVHSSKLNEGELSELFTSPPQPLSNEEQVEVFETLGTGYNVWNMDEGQFAEVVPLINFYRRQLSSRLKTHFGLKVSHIKEQGDKVSFTTQDGLTLEADQLVLCPGPWARSEVFYPYTQNLGIHIKRIVAFHIDDVAPPAKTVDFFFDEDAFFMPLEGGHKRLFSFTRTKWGVTPAESYGEITVEDREQGLSVLDKIGPRLSAQMRGGQVFCDAYNDSRAPIVTLVGQSGRIVFAGAANGSGYRLAPAIARDVRKTLQNASVQEMA